MRIAIIACAIVCFVEAASVRLHKGPAEDNANFYTFTQTKRILCYFAANGRWPPMAIWIYHKVILSGNVFWSLNDPSIRATCSGIAQVITVYRPGRVAPAPGLAMAPPVIPRQRPIVTTLGTTTTTTTTEDPSAPEPTEDSGSEESGGDIDDRGSESESLSEEDSGETRKRRKKNGKRKG